MTQRPLAANALGALRHWLVSGALPNPAQTRDAAAVADAARDQGLSGLLDAALHGCGEEWPHSVRKELRERQRALFVRGAQALELMTRVQSLLELHGLRVLPLKGAAMAETHYDCIADRPMGDVDALALDDWAETVDSLVRAGFREVERADHAFAFADPITGGLLELHHSVVSCPGFFPLDANAVWARSLPGRGQVKRLPAAADLLVQLSLHAAFQHGLALSLVQYLDFRRLLERTPPEPDRLIEAAGAARAEVALFVSLAAAEAVVGAPFPALVKERLASRVPNALGSWLLAKLRDPLALVTPGRAPVGYVRWQLASGRRVEFIRRSVLPPIPGVREPVWRRTLLGARRAGGLAHRWGLSALWH